METNDRTGDVAKEFGKHAGPNDWISSPALARRQVFKVRGMVINRYDFNVLFICDLIIITFVFLLTCTYRCVKSYQYPKTDSTSSVWRPTRPTSPNFFCTRGLYMCSKVAILNIVFIGRQPITIKIWNNN